jgi:hypothetical protein
MPDTLFELGAGPGVSALLVRCKAGTLDGLKLVQIAVLVPDLNHSFSMPRNAWMPGRLL